MNDETRLARLGPTQLRRLRDDVCLNSLYVRDYENRYGIDAHAVCAFFDGYADFLGNLMDEDGDKRDFFDALEDYDTRDNLRAWQDTYACGLSC